MKVDLSCVPLNDICEGCLSHDRNLTTEFDPEIRIFFHSIIEPYDCYSDAAHSRHPLALCWECMAIVKKITKYQKQVTQAHGELVKYMHHHTTALHPLSSLKPHVIPEFIIKEDDTPDPPVTLTADTEPLTFIKVENTDDDDFGGDLETCYSDDGVVDNNLKTVLNTDPFTYKEKKRKKKSKRKSDEEFNESDDEPLKKIAGDGQKEAESVEESVGKKPEENAKTPIEKKKKAKRKKNSDSDVVKKRSREKPAGVVRNARVSRKLERLNVPEGQLEMLILTWEQVEVERQKVLKSRSYSQLEYRCDLCAVGFNHRSKIDNHMKKHHPSAGPKVCSVCHIRCRDTHSMCSHRRRHRLRWRCTQCGEMFSRAEIAADHHARRHGAKSPTHTCNVCGHTASSLSNLRNHMRNHSERQKCEICAKSFRDRSSLRTHLFIHKGEKEYSCPRCEKRFLFKKAMEVHLVTHAPNAQLYCHQCDVNFKNSMSYYQHMKYNLKHIDPAMLKFACSQCEKKFAKAARLREHELAVHLHATPLACDAHGCSFVCSSRSVLRTHNRMVHRNLKAVRNHVCHTCGKAYSTKKSLEGHLRSHTGERPFLCALCSSTFSYEAALYNHNKLVHLKPKMSRRTTRPATPAPSAAPGPWPLSSPLELTPAFDQPNVSR